jgi:hypothetical protein
MAPEMKNFGAVGLWQAVKPVAFAAPKDEEHAQAGIGAASTKRKDAGHV